MVIITDEQVEVWAKEMEELEAMREKAALLELPTVRDWKMSREKRRAWSGKPPPGSSSIKPVNCPGNNGKGSGHAGESGAGRAGRVERI